MDDINKMLHAIINGQSALKQELLVKISEVNKKVTRGFEDVNKRMDELDNKLTKRLDKLGKSLAYLENDSPTREEHNELCVRVAKLEQKFAQM